MNKINLLEYPTDLYIPPDAMQICLEMFEGPLDLLLYLIRKQNLDILQIPISAITEQYLGYINAMKVLNIELASEYLLMAAILLEIKSRMLLPKIVNEFDGDCVNEEDPRQDLVNKLIEYEQMKQAGLIINDLPQANRDYLWLDIDVSFAGVRLPKVLASDLQNVWHTILLRSMQARATHQIERQILSVREQMGSILRYLSTKQVAKFYELFDVDLGVAHVVVNFVAILELTKEGIISISQDESQNIIVMLRDN